MLTYIEIESILLIIHFLSPNPNLNRILWIESRLGPLSYLGTEWLLKMIISLTSVEYCVHIDPSIFAPSQLCVRCDVELIVGVPDETGTEVLICRVAEMIYQY